MNEAAQFQPLHDTATLSRARSLWYAGEFSLCLADLENQPPSGERFLLAARASYRLRRIDDALAHLAAGHQLFHRVEEQAEADALSSVLHESKGNHRESDVFYDRALALDPKGEAGNANNMLALRAWMRDDYQECLRRLRFSEASDDVNVRAYALHLRSWTHASRTQFARQAELLAECLRMLSASKEPDVGLIAASAQALSHRCRELYLPEAFSVLCAAVADLRWTGDLRMHRYNTLRHIGWTYALMGQYVVGLRQLSAARDAAPARELAAVSVLDAAWVTWVSGERNAAQAHLQEALDMLAGVDWRTRRTEEVWALLLASELCATIQGNARRAEQMLSHYLEAKAGISVGVGVAHNRSFDPLEAYAQAVIHAGNGNVGPARKLAKQAYREFAAMGYEWRAARCALHLYESGCGDVWLAAAKACARNYPRSFIGAHLQRIEHESNFEPLAKLTPRQRDVVRLLAEGDTVDGVAAALNTSPGTVRVHLKHIHRALGVRNRVELLRAVKRSA